MDHTHIVQASELNRYPEEQKNQAQAVIPELVNHLVRQSVPDATNCRIPYGNAINQPGMDGIVNCENGYPPYVPDGKSYWEIGTGRNPRDKASKDLQKRTEQLDEKDRASSSFVVVTPRDAGMGGWAERSQAEWVAGHSDKGWKEIRVIDGIQLADWMREYPSIGRWMATKIGIIPRLGGVTTPLEHWKTICNSGQGNDPQLPAELFVATREGPCAALESLFKGEIKSNRLLLFAESERDVNDFVAAYLASLEKDTGRLFANQCLFISDESAWRSFVELRQSHVLVASPSLGLDADNQDLQTIAVNRGHRIIIPLCGVSSGETKNIARLRSPVGHEIESILKRANFTNVRARDLVNISGGMLSALIRNHLGLGALPSYANWKTARHLAQANFAGRWNAKSLGDIEAMSKLLGEEYREWIDKVRTDTLRSDSPLTQTDEKWRFIPRGEAWNVLGPHITDEYLDCLIDTSLMVLSERDPKFDLPKEDRYAANIRGKTLKYSPHIRDGLAETLALVGSRPKALRSCSQHKAEGTVIQVVRGLLDGANWERWASLDSLMPMLAEAAPDEFLDSVESALFDLSNTPFRKVFDQEGDGIFGGGSSICGLLWALETLAWNEEYLPRVSILLANLASIDPGGSWSNRPANSLADIFLPWYFQTAASFEKRKAAIEAVLSEQPKVGWNLILALLPSNHGITTGCRQPTWREYIPRDGDSTVLTSEYKEQIFTLTELAIDLAKQDVARLVKLIDHLKDLPESAYEPILNHLSSKQIVDLPDAERLPIWEQLEKFVRFHRKFHDSHWALPEDVVSRIEGVSNKLQPSDPEYKYRYLFSKNIDLYEEKGDYEAQHKKLEKNRGLAALEIITSKGLDGCLEFARSVTMPNEVGHALAAVETDNIEDQILPYLLDSDEECIERFVAGFISFKQWKFKAEWIDNVLDQEWSFEHKAKFLTYLPFTTDTWERVSSHLGDACENLYWENVNANPHGTNSDLRLAIEKLIKYGREGAALYCASHTIHGDSQFNETVAIQALMAFIENPKESDKIDGYWTVELIKRLQESQSVNQDDLLKIEWNFLPFFDKPLTGLPLTLEKKLANSPEFFAEVIGLIYRSNNIDKNDVEAPDEQRKNIATNAYDLLSKWTRCPGVQDDGAFNIDAFNEWIGESRRITEEAGHTEVAQIHIGHILTHSPPDPDGLWIHKAVAKVLNFRDVDNMRSGFTNDLFNQRGFHEYTYGKEERKIAKGYHENADELDLNGFTRLATSVRELAKQYEREAERAEKRDPFDD